MKPWHLLWVGCVLTATGCLDSQVTRARIDQETVKVPVVKTIGEISAVGNAIPIPVSGVGLVVGLDGTGGSAPPGIYRQMLEEYLKKKGFDNVSQILESPNHSMVMLSAVIPPGSKPGDPIDIQVTLPEGSKTKSLRNGHLELCNLITYDTLQNVRQYVAQATDSKPTGTNDRLLPGNRLVYAEGMLSPPADKVDDSVDWKSAWVWGGGHCEVENCFYILMNPDQQRYAVTEQAANRINEVFHGPGTHGVVAKAKSKDSIVVNVPSLYRLNVPRFLRVLRSIPLDSRQADAAYREKFEAELLEPATAISAALRLEAIGQESIPGLKAGLDSPYALVRFAAAEALCYLGYAASAEELGKLAEQHPVFQAYCLTALASLNEAVCYYKLTDLMGSSVTEVRYGAFRALREQDPNQEGIRGQKINKSFYLHKVAPGTVPMVHILTDKRCEIVLFGDTPALTAPFSFLIGNELTLTAKENDKVVTINRFSTKHGNQAEQCSLYVDDVIRTMAKMGGSYSEVIEMLKLANRQQCLNCKLAVQALPKALRVHQLADAGKTDPTLQKEAEMLQLSEELIEAPGLFDGNKK